MDPYVESFLLGEINLDPDWFRWKVEAVVAAGLVNREEGESWIARAKQLTAPGPAPSDSLRERVAALDLDRDTMIELHRAGIIDDEQLLEVAEREGPIW